MEKIIFLDLDGVLNIMEGPLATFKNKLEHFENHLINSFNKFLDDNKDVFIIISSSWRSDMADLLNMLDNSGFKFNYRIKGHTPLNSPELQFRGEQISVWLEENKFNGIYLAIDDSIDQICSFGKIKINRKYCLKVDPTCGLSDKDIQYMNHYFN